MSDILSLAERIAVSTVKSENASQIMHDVANGGPTAEVPTQSGPVPTIQKWFADLNDRTSGAVGQVEVALGQEVQARQQGDQALAQRIENLQPTDVRAEPALTPATQAEMVAGAEVALRSMSPLRVAQAIGALASPKILRSARTSNVQLQAGDSGKWIDITSSTFTQTFLAPAALGAGWWCYLQNSGSGDITIPSSDGRTNWIMYPNEVRLFQCDGTTLRSVVLVSFYRVFTTSGNFIKPPGYAFFDGLLWPGATSGIHWAGAPSGNTYAAGGYGAPAERLFVKASDIADTVPFVIGSGGVGASASGSNPVMNAGGASSFGSITVSSLGGGYNASSPRPDSASAWREGAPQLPLSPGSTPPTASLAGGTGGAGIDSSSAVTPGGKSRRAGQGGDGGNSTTPPKDGMAPAGGGGGSAINGVKAGDGARGELQIWGGVAK